MSKDNKAKQKTQSDHEQLKAKVEELTDALKRERADSENIRRRCEQQIQSQKNFVKIDLVRKLLPVIDNLNLALGHTPKELAGNDYVKGVEAVVRQFEKFLTDVGVERIKTVGQVFDPRLHEAIGMDNADESPDATQNRVQEIVSHELQAGYKLDAEIIRHASVKVKLQTENKK